jgi:hypothetical protein
MKTDTPKILWPAPGFPAFLESGNQPLDVIVATRDQESVYNWAGEISLRTRTEDADIPLFPLSVGPADPKEIAEHAAQLCALLEAARFCFVRVRLQPPAILPLSGARAMRLFDLCVKGIVARSRSVAIWDRPGATLKIAFAGDLHVAHYWNEIADAMRRYAPELLENAIDPHSLLDVFIDEANALAAGGNLDLVVLGGDLVDHVCRYPRKSKNNGSSSNVHLLLAMLDRLNVPTLMIPGNHDYRSYPRRPRSSGLESIGLSRRQSNPLLRKSGLWGCGPLSTADLDALRTRDAAGIPALSDYIMHAAPATDFSVSLRGLRLILVSSGCDILARWREVERIRLGMLARAVRTSLDFPDSEGFSETQITKIGNWLRECTGAALFFHAPLLSAGREMRTPHEIGLPALGSQDLPGRRVWFERQLQRAGLRCGVSFRNPGALIEKLASGGVPVATFSGHVHYASTVEIDRDTMRACFIDPNLAGSGSSNIILSTAPALCQLSSVKTQSPGYLLAQFKDGTLVSLQRCILNHRR